MRRMWSLRRILLILLILLHCCLDKPHRLAYTRAFFVEDTQMPGRSFGRKIGMELAMQMRALYEQRNQVNSSRVWTMSQLAERFQLSESSVRRAVLGLGPYRHLPDAAPFKSDQELREDAQALFRLAQQIEAEKAKAPNGDEMLARLDSSQTGEKEDAEAAARRKLKEHYGL